MSHLTRKDWQFALYAQSACNASGIIHGLSDVVSRVWDEARERGQGTDWVNHHAIVRLYVEQLIHLSGAGFGDTDSYSRAYAEVVRMAEGSGVDVKG